MPIFRSFCLLPLAALFAVAAPAQTHRVDAPEKVIRSIGVYEWTGNIATPDAARLIPVSLFVDGAFQDGGTYYSRPIPLALLNGNIYSLEKAGVPQGSVTLDYARHLQTATGAGPDNISDLGWFGYGTYATMPVERKSRALHASSAPPAIVSSKDDDRPTFVNRTHDASKSASTTSTADRKSSPADTTASAPAPDDDPDRPRFSKDKTPDKTPASTPAQTSSQAPASPSTTAPATTTVSDKSSNGSKEDTSPVIVQEKPEDDADRPTLRRRDPKQADADRKARDARNRSGVSAVGGLNDDPDRPNMRRGKTAGIGGALASQLTGMPTGLHQMVAVSDPATREPHPFARDWATPTERADILAKLQAIAQQQLAAYARTNAVDPPSPAAKPATRPAARSTTGVHHPPPVRRPAATPATPPSAPLTGEELTPYTLSYGGLPTFVYTAISAAPASTSASGVTLPERYVTVVAQLLPSGEVQTAFTSVTDAAHLDRTPWFRLVDAVDPDAEHRASLLFELRGHSSRQFALYRILSATAEQTFITHPTD